MPVSVLRPAAAAAPRPHPARRGGVARGAWQRLGWWCLPPGVLGLLGGLLLGRRHSFWYDELFTAEMVRLSFTDLTGALVSGEGNLSYLRDAPPSYNAPYYALARLWTALPGVRPDEVGLRALSLLAAVAAVALFVRAVGRMAGRTVAVVAGLVVATNPLVVEFAAEARGYGLALLGTATAALALARWLDGGRRSAVLFAVAAAGAGLAHWFAVLAIAGLVAAALILRRRAALAIVVAGAAGTVPVLVLATIAVVNGVGTSGVEWIGSSHGRVPSLLLRSWAGGWTALFWFSVGSLAVALAPPWPRIGARRSRRSRPGPARADGATPAGRRPTTLIVGAAWFGVPVAVVQAVEVVRPVFVDRYLLPACLGLALLVACGVTRPPGRWAALTTGAVLVTSASAGVAAIDRGPKEEVRAAVAELASAHRPGQPVVAAARWDALGLDHYARHDHPQLVDDLVLPPEPVPTAPAIWVLRRSEGGVKGDRDKLVGLDAELARRGLRLVSQRPYAGRYADTFLQRWEQG